MMFRLIVVFLILKECSSLSSVLSSSKDKGITTPLPIRRVAIIGAGIGGLTLAHSLGNSKECAREYVENLKQNPSNEVTTEDNPPGIHVEMFESRPRWDFEKAGAGIQITGGMAILKRINPLLQEAIAKAALPLKSVESKTKPWFRSETTDEFKLFDFNIEAAIRKAGGNVENELIVDGEVMAYAIMRPVLQEILFNHLPKGIKDKVKLGKTLSGIRGVTEEGIFCEFDDGSSEGPFDVVVGCDGVNSAVKEFVNTGKHFPNVLSKKSSQKIYSGIRIQYSIQESSSNQNNDSSEAITTTEDDASKFVQCFGDNVYALSSNYGAGEGKPSTRSVFLCYQDDDFIGPFRKKEAITTTSIDENSDWKLNQRKPSETRMEALDRIKDSGLPTSDILPVMNNADRIFELGVYYHNPFNWNGWSREVTNSGGRFCVLSGDAAHAMPPFLGQGGNQAIQDAFCLSKKIFEYNGDVMIKSENDSNINDNDDDLKTKKLKAYFKEYEKIRWAPTALISFKSFLLGYVEIGPGILSKFRDCLFFVLGNAGIAQQVFLSAAVPKVELIEEEE